MIDVNNLKSPADEERPIICTIVGEAGLGKTTLAASFPKPAMIRTEDGTASISDRKDVAMFDVAKSTDDVLDQLQALAEQQHGFKTVIIDSITQLATMIESEIVNNDGAKSINQALGGYGAGVSAAAEVHRKIRNCLDWLMNEKGMNAVVIAHADTENLEPPDSDGFSRYTVRMHRKAVQHWVDNVDLVGFIKLKKILKGKDQKKAISTGERIITCHPVASHISKNRFGIDQDLLFEKGKNPFADHLKIK